MRSKSLPLLSITACAFMLVLAVPHSLSAQKAASVPSMAKPPLPVLPIPTARQIAWQEGELAMFLHFGVNTFTDREWGEGTEDPQVFNPTQLDARQWARVAKETGFKTLILTAKHHDGFCLWPSRYTNHSVKSSPWRNGTGDVVRELAEACHTEGLRMGIYLSPWDRHEPSYGDSPAYNQYYAAQLHELLTQYGTLVEFWFDGACGEGPNGKRQVYDFPAYWALIRQLQPQAVIFSNAGPDIRWIGNESGFAGETCWSMMDRSKVAVGKADTQYLNTGDVNGPDWVPGECDVSIRDGWFWHKNQQPKSVEQLLDIYFKSIGRNGVLLLNVPPDNRGLLADADIKRLREFVTALREIFQTNLAAGKIAYASNVRGNSTDFSAQQVLDGNPKTYWAADDSVTKASLEVELDKSEKFNVVSIQELIALGQRVQAFNLQIEESGGWKTVAQGTTIGYKRLIHIPETTARRLRLVIDQSRACPLIAEFGLYSDPHAAKMLQDR